MAGMDPARVLMLIAQEPVNDTDAPHVGGRLQRLCRAAAAAVPASGVGVSVMSDAGPQLTVASSALHAEVEELQFTVGEGPCLAAVASGAPVLTSDLAGSAVRRWPGYAPAALERGICAVFAFPLQVGAARLGALDVYQHRVGPLSAEALPLVLDFARVAVVDLLDAGRSLDDATPSEDDLLDGDRSELYQAQGMVMVQLGVTLAEAMSRLRAHAFTHDRRLRDVAEDVVARRITFTEDDA